MNVKTVVKRYLRSKGLPVDTAVTFADVFLVDCKSEISSRADITDLSTRFTEGINLNIPIVSANMADVTESRMAISLARLGGCGFIHQFMPIERRLEEVKKVKRADNEVIVNPWTVKADWSLSSALGFMKDRQTSGVLVIDNEGILVGILTARDIRFLQFKKSIATCVRDVMTKNLVTAGLDIEIENAIELLECHKLEKLPLINKEGKPVGLITAQDILKKLKYLNAVRDNKGRLLVGAAIGIAGDFFSEAVKLVSAEIDVLLIDTARANSVRTEKVVERIKHEFPDQYLVVGNIDNAESALMLIEAGADAIKVGIGPGSACKTRIETGVGMPQLSAIAECAAIAREFGIPVIADGGIKSGGDLAKAIVAGADSVMLGGMFSGTEETPGDVFFDDGNSFKYYRGSASLESQVHRKDLGHLDRIRAPEGARRRVSYKGQKVSEITQALLDNLRSTMSYVNANNINELKKAVFRLQTRSGFLEGKPRKK